MKKIINGKKYDTDTAKLIGSYSNGRTGNDLSYVYEELYRKKTGEYFLYGEGGPWSDYYVKIDNSNYSGSCRITPMTNDEAEKWALEHLEVDEFEAAFYELEE